MVNLARRKKQIDVEIPGEDVTLTVETLSQPEYSEAVGDAMAQQVSRQGELDEEAEIPLGKLISAITRFAHTKIIDADGVTVEGEDFNPANEEHLDALPGQWMVAVANELAQEATISDSEGKDSAAPDEPSTTDTTPDAPSPDVSAASSTASSGSTGRD